MKLFSANDTGKELTDKNEEDHFESMTSFKSEQSHDNPLNSSIEAETTDHNERSGRLQVNTDMCMSKIMHKNIYFNNG